MPEFVIVGRFHNVEGLNAWEVMSKILTAMLNDPILGGVILVVDALDECEAGRPQLLEFIIRLSASSRARWIVSSRNWPDIEEKLGSAAQKAQRRLDLQCRSRLYPAYSGRAGAAQDVRRRNPECRSSALHQC
ncbi:hypothetical protein DL768_011434 [Monosporascus sp. mg162]|nr:hypothetical protein DL768_011434 [Monosporascus sp. mg162]